MELEEEEALEKENANGGGDAVTDFSTRVLNRIQREEDANKDKEDEAPQPVDVLSLSALLAQGIEEGKARRALRLHKNDTQAALDWLVEGEGENDTAQKMKSGEV